MVGASQLVLPRTSGWAGGMAEARLVARHGSSAPVCYDLTPSGRRHPGRGCGAERGPCSSRAHGRGRYVEADATAGEAAAVVALVTKGMIVGASVGDSEAWLLARGGVVRLTSNQRRKPLLGSGAGAGRVRAHAPRRAPAPRDRRAGEVRTGGQAGGCRMHPRSHPRGRCARGVRAATIRSVPG